jgi:hypothetical protein
LRRSPSNATRNCQIPVYGYVPILASIQAANGVIIFSSTTALIFYHLQAVYTRK